MIKYNSPVILSFSILCIVILILNQLVDGALTPFFSVGTSIDPTNPLSVLTLFSHILGHANPEHLLGNLTFVLLIGPIIEEKYGSRSTLFMILVTALLTGLINIFFFSTGLLGASGIVFMLIILVSFTNTEKGGIPLTFILIAILFIGKEIYYSFRDDNIAQFAHIIGGVSGSIFGFFGLSARRRDRNAIP